MRKATTTPPEYSQLNCTVPRCVGEASDAFFGLFNSKRAPWFTMKLKSEIHALRFQAMKLGLWPKEQDERVFPQGKPGLTSADTWEAYATMLNWLKDNVNDFPAKQQGLAMEMELVRAASKN